MKAAVNGQSGLAVGTLDPGFEPFDQLASMVALVAPDGRCLQANSALENIMGVSRRALMRGSILDWLSEPEQLRETLGLVARNEVATSRFDGALRRQGAGHLELPVHVIVNQTESPERVLVELIEIEQQIRLDREERTHGLAQANKELVRNLAHEIKNPLGGIRGAAQLLAMEVTSRELTEYTQVIIHEADRLQALVDRLLAPHRRPQVVADVNIHEVCERVRSASRASPRAMRPLYGVAPSAGPPRSACVAFCAMFNTAWISCSRSPVMSGSEVS